MNSHSNSRRQSGILEREPLLLNGRRKEELGPPKNISKLNRILIAVIVGLVVLMSVFVGLFAGAEVNYKRAQESKETVTVIQPGKPQPTHPPKRPEQPPSSNFCLTRSCFRAAKDILESVDTSIDPCDSFYDYANGGWLNSHPIPPSKSVYSIFNELGDRNIQTVKSAVFDNVGTQEYSPQDKENLKSIKTLYDSCTNTKVQDKLGAEPILDVLDDFESVIHQRHMVKGDYRKTMLTHATAFLQSMNIGGLFSFSLDGDVGKDPSRQVPVLSQSDALSLPDKDYYEDYANVNLIAEITYQILVAVHERDFHSKGITESKKSKKNKHHKPPKLPTRYFRRKANDVARFEQDLARISWSQVDSANPLKTYNPKTITELSELAPYVYWNEFFALQGTSDDDSIVEPVIVANPSYFEDLASVLEVDDATLETYFLLRIVLNLGSSLSPKTHMAKIVNDFTAKMSGTDPKAEKDIDLDCLNGVVDQVGFLAGRPFVLEAFPGESKTNFEGVVDGIIDAFINRLPSLGWLDNKTVDAAANKARVLHDNKKIGYPTAHPNTSDPTDLARYYDMNEITEDDWFGNTLRAKEADAARLFQKAGKVAEGEWDMFPTEVNAYYQPSKNEIVFPAGILQPPFFKADWPQVLNYGSAGSVAAHELCHAFDQAGRQYEADGRLIFDGSWWSDETVKAFEERAECIINQYNQFTVPGPDGKDLNVNGRFVIGEAIGDLGLVQAYNAWKHAEEIEESAKLPGLKFTDEQLFFISFARGWARKTRLEENLKRIKTDPHAPTKWRVDGTLRNTPEFAKAFGCTQGSIMNPPLEEQCRMCTDLTPLASGGASNISEEPMIKISGSGANVSESISKGTAYNDVFKTLLDKVFRALELQPNDITATSHRVVHGGDIDKPIVVTQEHSDKLKDLDRISALAPLHNKPALMALEAVLEHLPASPAVIVFDTLFHRTLPEAVRKYAIGKPDHEPRIPLQKYGAHGLSYHSILRSVASKLGKKETETSIVVAHLGSGGSACAIKNGISVDTTMGLTPLEGLPGGSRTGSIDPTLIFHLIRDVAETVDVNGMRVSRGEYVMNKQGGFVGLCGTSNFGKILEEIPEADAECWKPWYQEEMPNAFALAYAVYLDRLTQYLLAYLQKLSFGTHPKKAIDALVFSGGIGEKSARLRKDVADRLSVFGVSVVDSLNEQAGDREADGAFALSNDTSKIPAYVCWTDEEGEAARQAKMTLNSVLKNEADWNLNGLIAFQRAANFIAVSMIFLKSNTLLSRQLSKDDIKPRLLGHFGTCPGLNLVYAHTNALIKRREKEGTDLKSIFVTGPGHGAPAILASLFLEGSITKFYPQYTMNKDGFEAFARCFSFPGGTFPSHVSAQVPGSIHEGGELGYALAVSFGAIMDKPDMIAVCVIGDGESETGPTAASLHSHKFIDPAESGAVLPILHVNGYKISERTIPGAADDLELVALYSGYGYQVRFVEYGPLASSFEEHTEKDRRVNADLAVSMEWAYGEIRKIQHAARSGNPIEKPRFPFIVLRTPKGYTGPRQIHNTPLEGSFHSHQVPLPKCKSDDEEFSVLGKWLKSYQPDEIFNLEKEDGEFVDKEALSIVPAKESLRLGQVKETYDAHQSLNVPQWKNHTKSQGETYSPMIATGEFLADVMKQNPETFRMFSPDELESNKLHKVFDVTSRDFQWDPESAHKGGRVIEMLSEHTLQGFLQGYTLTGRTGLFPSYEAFLGIAATMMTQYSKFIKSCKEVQFRGDVSSLNYIATSTLWRQEHNGYSHQAPGLISTFQTFPAHLSRIYFPIDVNTTLSCIAHCLRSKNYLNLIVGSKQPGPVLMSADQAEKHCIAGASVWKEYSTDQGVDPEVVLVGIGTEVTFEVLAASVLLRNSGVRVRVVNIYDLMILAGNKQDHPHALDENSFNSLFTKEKPVLISYHGYALQVSSLLFQREHSLNRGRFSIDSYKENGTTTTPWLMFHWNKVSRFQVADRAIKEVAHYSPQSHASTVAHLYGTNWLHEGRNMEKYANETGADHEDLGKLPQLVKGE
ncbi:hypothetical protein E3P84_02284 [Wallemia ichthyophaga]|nr:hypothetical protein E3P84_02284 [Wallemia ichthyophaga]TIB41196.1 hypothetical protein E3P83_02237 [Wallemia ichthyophaga]